MTNHLYRTILLIILVFAGFCTASAQESDAEEARLDHIVFIYYEGTNEYEFYKAIGNYRKYVKGKHDSHKYYQSWYKEIAYDIYHNHYHKALSKMEQFKEELKKDKAEDYYYLLDYLMGIFYGARENVDLSRQHLLKAASAVNPEQGNSDLIAIYQTLANISIFDIVEKDLEGYNWADKALAISKQPGEQVSSLSLKAMVAFGHHDRRTFDYCWNQIESIKQKYPDEDLSMYQRYVRLARYAFDGDYDKAVWMSDSIQDEVGKLYFLAYIYKMKGDLQAENEALVSLLKAKDHRSNDISTLTINDIDQDIELELERLHKQKTEQYTRIILVGIVALTLLFLAWFRWRRK